MYVLLTPCGASRCSFGQASNHSELALAHSELALANQVKLLVLLARCDEETSANIDGVTYPLFLVHRLSFVRPDNLHAGCCGKEND